jgi:hypothetical protein
MENAMSSEKLITKLSRMTCQNKCPHMFLSLFLCYFISTCDDFIVVGEVTLTDRNWNWEDKLCEHWTKLNWDILYNLYGWGCECRDWNDSEVEGSVSVTSPTSRPFHRWWIHYLWLPPPSPTLQMTQSKKPVATLMVICFTFSPLEVTN